MVMHLQRHLLLKKNMGFFDTLERAYDISPRNNIKIVVGNFNA